LPIADCINLSIPEVF